MREKKCLVFTHITRVPAPLDLHPSPTPPSKKSALQKRTTLSSWNEHILEVPQ